MSNFDTTNLLQWAVKLLANFKSVPQEATAVRDTQNTQQNVLS